MLIRQEEGFHYGYNVITEIDGKHSETLMDFGILKLKKGMSEINRDQKERAYLLIKGEVVFNWEGNTIQVERKSFLDENPCCLHIPAGVEVSVNCIGEYAELSVSKTFNGKSFSACFYTQKDIRSEERGKGTMGETSTRIVRTVFDITNADYSNLVLGEVITYPGKWSSYPPHHHPQPEIYYYRFQPEQGFGFANLGDEVLKVSDNDTVLILDDKSHPQAAAPGYAMYYIWVIRHLDGNPYINPVFEPEHTWVMEKNAKIYPER